MGEFRAVVMGNPVLGNLITRDGEFILRLLLSMAHIYECPPGYEKAWQNLRDLNLIEYRSSMLDGGFRPTDKGRKALDRSFKMGDHYGEDPVQDRLSEVAENIIDVENAIGTTNELLGKILALLENPADRKIVHININCEAGGYTSESLARLVERLRGV